MSVNSRLPLTAASHKITPHANTSARPSTRSPRACSGAMYASLPFTVPTCVGAEPESFAFAIPKSTTFTSPEYVTKML